MDFNFCERVTIRTQFLSQRFPWAILIGLEHITFIWVHMPIYNRPCQQLWKEFEKNVLLQSFLFIKNEWLILEIQQGLQNFSSPRIPSSIGQDVRPSRVHLGHMLCANQIFFCNLLLWQVMIDLILLLHRTITNTTFIVFSEYVISTIIKIGGILKSVTSSN